MKIERFSRMMETVRENWPNKADRGKKWPARAFNGLCPSEWLIESQKQLRVSSGTYIRAEIPNRLEQNLTIQAPDTGVGWLVR